MKKEIRMSYSEYEALLRQIENQEEYINNLNKLIEEKDNVLILERSYSKHYFYSAKVIDLPSSNYYIDEIFKRDVEAMEEHLVNVIKKHNTLIEEIKTLKSKIPWWRK